MIILYPPKLEKGGKAEKWEVFNTLFIDDIDKLTKWKRLGILSVVCVRSMCSGGYMRLKHPPSCLCVSFLENVAKWKDCYQRSTPRRRIDLVYLYGMGFYAALTTLVLIESKHPMDGLNDAL